MSAAARGPGKTGRGKKRAALLQAAQGEGENIMKKAWSMLL